VNGAENKSQRKGGNFCWKEKGKKELCTGNRIIDEQMGEKWILSTFEREK
jgi:hypothetical protein